MLKRILPEDETSSSVPLRVVVKGKLVIIDREVVVVAVEVGALVLVVVVMSAPVIALVGEATIVVGIVVVVSLVLVLGAVVIGGVLATQEYTSQQLLTEAPADGSLGAVDSRTAKGLSAGHCKRHRKSEQ